MCVVLSSFRPYVSNYVCFAGCAPEESEEADICQCPPGYCFDPDIGCLEILAETNEPTPGPPTGNPTFSPTGEGEGGGDGDRDLPTSGAFAVQAFHTALVGIVLVLCGELVGML
jgi:hypothetical protein